jgi:glyoxylase-like metal-dependent hydrolase (beta-lactamase superfamily II)
MEITRQIHMIHGMANQYLIIDRDELTLIDSGMASNSSKVIKYVKSLGFQPENLKRILITHSDIDHIGAVNSLREISGAKVFASKIEALAMKIGEASREIDPTGIWMIVFKLFSMFLKNIPIEVDDTLEDGEILPILNGLKVISSSGHTPGHISFFFPEERVLFAGDSINDRKGKPIPNLTALTRDKVEAQKSFDKEMGLNPFLICCGHAYIDLRGK